MSKKVENNENLEEDKRFDVDMDMFDEEDDNVFDSIDDLEGFADLEELK